MESIKTTSVSIMDIIILNVSVILYHSFKKLGKKLLKILVGGFLAARIIGIPARSAIFFCGLIHPTLIEPEKLYLD